ncbi:D-2-hydroxyacid dehydrogenase [Shewanella maritima]|uniref:D-2-hydroxyacid dehydrogenase n=1 Tax=Shewanella maritima TaxID=2520507 RepID=UPI003736308B
MKIVVLDGYTLNPGDLSWQPLLELGECDIYQHSQANEVLARAKDAQVLLTNKTVIDRQLMAQLPQLKYIGVLATGTNVVDVAYAIQQGIVVTNVPAYGPDAVAQMVFAHILHHSQHLAVHHDAVVKGLWSNNRDFCFTLAPLMSLKHKTIGLIGYGDIGKQVAKIAQAFNMKVLIHTPNKKLNLDDGLYWCELPKLLQQADIISLHCPLTPITHHLINAASLAIMQPGCLLINTARGDLISETELALWLNQERGFAGVDVLSTEPPEPDNPLLSAKNISISPHIAWATVEARQNLLNIAMNNLQAFGKGEPVNQVLA